MESNVSVVLTTEFISQHFHLKQKQFKTKYKTININKRITGMKLQSFTIYTK